jgi:hypothetical protein
MHGTWEMTGQGSKAIWSKLLSSVLVMISGTGVTWCKTWAPMWENVRKQVQNYTLFDLWQEVKIVCSKLTHFYVIFVENFRKVPPSENVRILGVRNCISCILGILLVRVTNLACPGVLYFFNSAIGFYTYYFMYSGHSLNLFPIFNIIFWVKRMYTHVVTFFSSITGSWI